MTATISEAPSDWKAVEPLLSSWRETIGDIQNAHYRSAIHTSRVNLQLGIPIIVISTCIGGASIIQCKFDMSPGMVLGIVSIIGLAAAMLAGLQTFFNFKERSERHHSAGVRFGALVRLIDETKSLPAELRGSPKDFLDRVRTEWDAIQADSPMISQRVWASSKEIPRRIAGRDE